MAVLYDLTVVLGVRSGLRKIAEAPLDVRNGAPRTFAPNRLFALVLALRHRTHRRDPDRHVRTRPRRTTTRQRRHRFPQHPGSALRQTAGTQSS
jgi:hypothetical protein